MKDFILSKFVAHERPIAEKLLNKDKDGLKDHHSDIVAKVSDKLLDLIDQTRSYGYEIETGIDKLLPITNFSEFSNFCNRRGLHINGAEAKEKLSEILSENPNFNFEK